MPNEKPVPQQIPLAQIHDLPGVDDPKLPEKSYGTLVSSILLNGLKEPVILRQAENGEYQLIHGYRRRRAAELAKQKEIAAFVYDMTEQEALAYRKAQATEPKAPIPGKRIEKSAEKPTVAKTAAMPNNEPSKPAKEEKEPPPEAKDTGKVKNKEETVAAAEPAKAEKAAKKKATVEKVAEEKKTEDQTPPGPVALGPTGTLITRLLGEKLSPPTEKEKKEKVLSH